MTDNQESTKRRLLEAAGHEFAQRGFEGATIRAICEKAEANVAAVNYYFGSKEALYSAAVVEAHHGGVAKPEERLLPSAPPEEQLALFIRHFLEHVLAVPDENSWHHILMMRELARPTQASEVLIRDMIGPRCQRLHEILRALCPGVDDVRLAAITFSIVGQCLHYRFARTLSAKLVGEDLFQKLDLDYLTSHITAFSLAALGRAAPIDPCEARRPMSPGTTSALEGENA